jgi:hypothetical protein
MLCEVLKSTVKMSSIIIYCLFVSIFYVSGDSTIENDCKLCTEDGKSMFVKYVAPRQIIVEYVCLTNTLSLYKNINYLGHVCNETECINLESRVLLRSSSSQEATCPDSSLQTPNNHIFHLKILELIKSYCEILLILFVVCVLYNFVKRLEPHLRTRRLRRRESVIIDAVSM